MPQPRKHPLPPLPIRTGSISERIIKYRKLRGLTQKQLAEKIGITRDILASYESGRTRLNDELVVRFALALRISCDELLGIANGKRTLERAPNVRLIRRIQRIEELSRADQKVILRTIDSFLAGAKVQTGR